MKKIQIFFFVFLFALTSLSLTINLNNYYKLSKIASEITGKNYIFQFYLLILFCSTSMSLIVYLFIKLNNKKK